MTSKLKVEQIAHTNNVSAMTIDSTGRVNLPQLIAFTAYVNDGNGVDVTVGNKVPYDATVINKGNAYNTSTYVFTAPVAGVYWFSFSVWSNNTSSTARAAFYKNGTAVGRSDYPIGTRHQTSAYEPTSASSAIELAANDTVDIRVYGATANVFGTNYFSGYLIG